MHRDHTGRGRRTLHFTRNRLCALLATALVLTAEGAKDAGAEQAVAAERERIAQAIEAKAEKGFIWTDGSGPEYEMLKAAAYSRASALGEAAAIARGGE